MPRTIKTRLGCWMAPATLTLVLAAMQWPVLGADDRTPVKKAASRSGHRLPPHYTKQRESSGYVPRSDISRLRPSSTMSILSSRASQPMACMTLSRGSPTALISLAIGIVPFSESMHQTTPATSPIDATHDSDDVVVI